MLPQDQSPQPLLRLQAQPSGQLLHRVNGRAIHFGLARYAQTAVTGVDAAAFQQPSSSLFWLIVLFVRPSGLRWISKASEPKGYKENEFELFFAAVLIGVC